MHDTPSTEQSLTGERAHRVVIIGGGFGGLYAARSLRRAPVRVTLIDRRNFHLFQPLLYQVATGALSPANIAAPLRAILKRSPNADVILGEVVDIVPDTRRVQLRDGTPVEYDSLIVATGSSHHYFGNENWQSLAPGLKTVEDATEIRGRILMAFEDAEKEPDAERRRELMRFVVIGGGPTGVEMAGALAEIARQTLRGNFRRIDPAQAEIMVVEAADRILGGYPPDLSAKAQRELAELGVQVQTRTMVKNIRPGAVEVETQGRRETIRAATVIWSAGVKASRLGKILAERAGAPLDKAGRVVVEPDCTVPGHPEIFVIGDLAYSKGPDGKLLPGVAQVAMQQGKYAAEAIVASLGGHSLPPFRYRDYGSMAVIGRRRAVAMIAGLRLSGFLAWLTWLFVHLMYIVQFTNRLLVFVQWAYSYFTHNRSARLITNVYASRERPQAEPSLNHEPGAEAKTPNPAPTGIR
ncbi:MAG: NAD(P)/FAD-dependent oxidoreductase [Acidobacteria bacterium]|nr:MAG: NAD(P)/FAD-dependent oxidoreductase [Acidobacteriota bacterium]